MPSTKETKERKGPKYIGSDCIYCVLEEGVYSMMYFCKLKSKRNHRVICDDGFTRTCPEYKKEKKR